MQAKTAETIDEDEKMVKRLFKALPYFPSHTMGGTRPHPAATAAVGR